VLSSARAASVDGALFDTLPIEFLRQRFGEDSSRTEIPEAAANGQMPRHSAVYRDRSPTFTLTALVKQFRTLCMQRAASFHAASSGVLARSARPFPMPRPVVFRGFRALTQV